MFSGGTTVLSSFSEATSNVSMFVAFAMDGRPLMGAVVVTLLVVVAVVAGVVGVTILDAVVA